MGLSSATGSLNPADIVKSTTQRRGIGIGLAEGQIDGTSVLMRNERCTELATSLVKVSGGSCSKAGVIDATVAIPTSIRAVCLQFLVV